jgi:hypothetical protein
MTINRNIASNASVLALVQTDKGATVTAPKVIASKAPTKAAKPAPKPANKKGAAALATIAQDSWQAGYDDSKRHATLAIAYAHDPIATRREFMIGKLAFFMFPGAKLCTAKMLTAATRAVTAKNNPEPLINPEPGFDKQGKYTRNAKEQRAYMAAAKRWSRALEDAGLVSTDGRGAKKGKKTGTKARKSEVVAAATPLVPIIPKAVDLPNVVEHVATQATTLHQYARKNAALFIGEHASAINSAIETFYKIVHDTRGAFIQARVKAQHDNETAKGADVAKAAIIASVPAPRARKRKAK